MAEKKDLPDACRTCRFLPYCNIDKKEKPLKGICPHCGAELKKAVVV